MCQPHFIAPDPRSSFWRHQNPIYPKPHIPPLRDQAVARVTICIGVHKFSPHNGAIAVSTSCCHSTALLHVQQLPAKRSAHLQSNMEAPFDIGYSVCAEAGDENNKIIQPENELKNPVCGGDSEWGAATYMV